MKVRELHDKLGVCITTRYFSTWFDENADKELGRVLPYACKTGLFFLYNDLGIADQWKENWPEGTYRDRRVIAWSRKHIVPPIMERLKHV